MATPAIDPVDGAYHTPRGHRLAADSVSWVATRSGGPGGQHANTSDTAVTVSIDVALTGLSQTLLERVYAAVGPWSQPVRPKRGRNGATGSWPGRKC